MNLKHIAVRLEEIESATRRVCSPNDRADPTAVLKLLAHDQTASELYTRALIEMGRLDCAHQRFGWCQPCIEEVARK